MEPITFDERTTASEIWLVGAGDGAEIRPSERDPSGVLFTIRDGAPPIHVQGLTLSGSVHVAGGRLHITRCVFGEDQAHAQRRRSLQGSETPPPRALTVVAGDAIVEQATFLNFTGGAIAVAASGNLTLRDSQLRSNQADFGGAVLVRGGHAVVERCLIEGNRAREAGGGLHVIGGTVVLRNRTVLRGNEASFASSISIASAGAVSYVLPTPLAHYVFVTGLLVNRSLVTSSINVDFPFPCPGGVVGHSYASLAQSGPWCSGVCPAGFACRAGTEVPELCPPGARVTRICKCVISPRHARTGTV